MDIGFTLICAFWLQYKIYEFTVHTSRHQKKFSQTNESIRGTVMITVIYTTHMLCTVQHTHWCLNFFVVPLSEWLPFFPIDVSWYVDIKSTTLVFPAHYQDIPITTLHFLHGPCVTSFGLPTLPAVTVLLCDIFDCPILGPSEHYYNICQWKGSSLQPQTHWVLVCASRKNYSWSKWFFRVWQVTHVTRKFSVIQNYTVNITSVNVRKHK
jgi:hypothetical protein